MEHGFHSCENSVIKIFVFLVFRTGGQAPRAKILNFLIFRILNFFDFSDFENFDFSGLIGLTLVQKFCFSCFFIVPRLTFLDYASYYGLKEVFFHGHELLL